MEYKFVQKTVNPKEIDLTPIPELEALKEHLPELYPHETAYFNYYNIPVVTPQLKALIHKEDVKAAIINGVEELSVSVAENISEGEYVRFILAQYEIKKIDDDAHRRKLIGIIENYLKHTEYGKVWRKALKKLGKNDINQEIASILDCSPQLIKAIRNSNEEKESTNRPQVEELTPSDIDLLLTDDESSIIVKGVEYDMSDVDLKITKRKDLITIQFKISKHAVLG